ncbi:MAG: type II secretion system protein [Acidobacteria bacterium]|nr:MAG: type II secretion system protein [Acidobacteriota bacterium]
MRDVNHTNRGFTLIELLTVMSIMGIICSIALLILGLNPKRAANEANAIAGMRTLITAEKVYWVAEGRFVYGDLSELAAENLIDEILASGHRQGYDYTVSKDSKGFTITATPQSTQTGIRSFFADDSGIIRAKAGTGCGPGDPPLGN